MTDQLRRLQRIPKLSAKYLESIKSELQDSDTEYDMLISLFRQS